MPRDRTTHESGSESSGDEIEEERKVAWAERRESKAANLERFVAFEKMTLE